MTDSKRTDISARIAAVLLCVLGVPAVLGLSGFFTDAPIVVDEPSPRTVIATDTVRVPDEEQTELQRRQAEQAVEPVVTPALDNQAAIISRVQDTFAVVSSSGAPGPDGSVPSRSERIAELAERLADIGLTDEAILLLVDLTDSEVSQARSSAVSLAQQAASSDLLEEDLETYANTTLQRQLALSAVDRAVANQILDPLLRSALLPTISVDDEATEAARAAARDAVEPVEFVVQRGTPIVRAGDVVTDVQLEALVLADLEGSDPTNEFARALLLSVILSAVVAIFIRAYRPHIWASGRRLLLLSTMLVLFAAIMVAINTVDVGGSERHYLIPVGAIAMLATILFDARIGVLVVVPMVALIAYQVPGLPGIVPFAAVAGLLSIPLVRQLSARGQLRTAAWQSTVAFALLAGTFNLIYKGTEGLIAALVAGALNGVLSALMVNGLLPFLEAVFGVLTATSLLDYADRNHALLRELESKALGTYNHSVTVATLASRACRRIGADGLLAEVMALYHDIGKVAKPYFFVENQVGISNPHEAMNNPRESALIIQRHVKDGVEMALTHKLPVEIVDGIRTHHGTTKVAFFYRQAVTQAAERGLPEPEEAFFRYKDGRKPDTREQAVLMLSDCCEGAVRAASQHDNNLTRDKIQGIVSGLIGDRVADGQLDDSPLTFADLRTVEASLVESLEGVYHPRIQYPEDPHRTAAIVEEARRDVAHEAEAAAAAELQAALEAAEPQEPTVRTGDG